MNRLLWTGLRAAALLAGVLVTLTASNPIWTYETVLDSDLAFVPPKTTMLITVRAADLASKLGIKDAGEKHPWAAAWQKQVGIPLNQVERCTLIGADNGAGCYILRTNVACKRREVLKACVPDARKEEYQGKVYHVSAANSTAVYFHSDNLVLVGDKDAVKQCLAHQGPRSAYLKDILTRIGRHDVILWSEAVPMNVTSCKRPVLTAPAADRTVSVAWKPNLAADEGQNQPRVEVPMKTLGFTMLPGDIEAGTIFVDIGDKMTIDMRLDCNEEATARKAEKMLHAFAEMGRGILLTLISEQDLLAVFPELVEGPGAGALPGKLMRHAEKGLQEAKFRTDGKTGMTTITIPVDAKTLRSEMKGLVMMAAMLGCDHLDLPAPLGRVDDDDGKYVCPQSSAAYGRTPIAPTPAQAYPYAPSAPPVYPPPTPLPPAGPPPTLQPQLPIAPAVQQMKFTVANVRKEMAVLFVMDDNGNMSFAAKVPAGEAVDLQTINGQRWIAVFTDNPAAESFVVKQGAAIWLLRPPPMPVPVTPYAPVQPTMTAPPPRPSTIQAN